MSPPNIQFIGASGLGLDWDTYENGVWQESPVHNTTSFYSTGNYTTYGARELKAPTANASTWGDYIRSWWSYSYAPTAEMNSGYTFANADPYLAIWDCVNGSWLGVAPLLEDSFGRIVYSTSSNTNFKLFYQNLSSLGNTCIFVPLTADPGDISGWRDYDGPDDWDTWEDGIYRTVSNNSVTNPVTELKVGSLTASTGFRWLGTEVRLNGIDQSVAPAYVAIWFPAQDTGIGGPITERWELYSFADGSQNSAGNSNFAYVESSDGSSQLPTNRLYDCFVVLLTRQPNDITTWRDYDGPLFASWDEPQRESLVAYVDPWGTSGLYASYYEDTPLWTTVAQTGGKFVPDRIARNSQYSVIMYTEAGADSMSADQFNLEVSSMAMWNGGRSSPYNNWFPLDNLGTGTFKTAYSMDTSPIGLDFNTFYTYAPLVTLFFGEEVGDTRYWPEYDGPVANWDTYANGVYITDYLLTSGSPLYAIPSYPATTYTDAMTAIWLQAVSGGYVPASANYISNYDGDEAPYIAVYIHEYSDDVENGGGSNAKGWYVFKNDIPSTGTYSRTQWETPIAWPSDVSTSRQIAYNENGFLGSNAGINSGYIVVFLDEYNDPVGSGGTDHWTKPPFVISALISSIDLSTQRMGLDFGGSSQPYANTYNGITDFGSYNFNPIRALTWLAKDMSGYGTVDIEVYHDSLLVGTGTWNATVGDTGVDFVSFSSLVGYPSQNDFYNSIAVNDRMWFIAYYND